MTMQHDDSKERQEASLVGRIFSMEAVLLVMGCVSLAYGLINREHMSIFWGVVIIPGVFLLHKLRKKDWQAHWAELEEEKRRFEELKKREKDGNGAN